MSKGMRECTVCHREFALIAEDHYIAKDPTPTGLAGLAGGTVYPYDAIDCPHCGCQNVLQKRKPIACPCDYGICDECCAEDEEEEEEGPTLGEMVDFLKGFCDNHTCSEGKCPLCIDKFKCGRGEWFDVHMPVEKIKEAYKIAKEAK